jgi:hypothetical protein
MTALRKEPKATKQTNHGIIRLVATAAKIVIRIIMSRRLKRKLR